MTQGQKYNPVSSLESTFSNTIQVYTCLFTSFFAFHSALRLLICFHLSFLSFAPLGHWGRYKKLALRCVVCAQSLYFRETGKRGTDKAGRSLLIWVRIVKMFMYCGTSSFLLYDPLLPFRYQPYWRNQLLWERQLQLVLPAIGFKVSWIFEIRSPDLRFGSLYVRLQPFEGLGFTEKHNRWVKETFLKR